MNWLKKGIRKIPSFFAKVINIFRLNRSKKRLKSFKNMHKGKRCFIVGNGPSLRIDDLEKIKKEICFGTHRIYNIFDKTSWRPTYYCAQDYKLIRSSKKDINALNSVNEKFIAMGKSGRFPFIKKCQYVLIKTLPFYPDMPMFSNDITECIYEGYTVSYMCIQMAVYMGFDEIYLLGIDHNYSKSKLPNGQIAKNPNVKDHFSENDTIENIPELYKSTKAYEKSKLCEKEFGFKIYNATRGGNLEVFERVDFDSLF